MSSSVEPVKRQRVRCSKDMVDGCVCVDWGEERAWWD